MSMILEKDQNRIKVIIPNSEATISAQLKCIKDSEVTGYYMNDKEEIKKEFVNYLADEFDYLLNVPATVDVITRIKDNFYDDYKEIYKDNFSSLESSLNYFKSINNNVLRIPRMFYSGQNNRYFKFENSDPAVKKLREILYGDITGFYISKNNNYYIITPYLVENAKEILEKRKTKILNNSDIQYWTYSPGENGSVWDYCFENNKMLLGWDEIGDYSKYANKDEIANAIKEAYGQDNPFNSIAAVNSFCYELKPNDIVIAKIGQTKLLGYGQVIDNEYYFDDSIERYKNVRNVKWLKKGEWALSKDDQVAQKTLTNITEYKDFVKRLMNIMNGGEKMKEKFRNWLENNPSTNNGSIPNYVNSITTTSNEAIEDGFIDKSIYDIDNLEEFDRIDKIIRQPENIRFNERRVKHDNINTGALYNYRKFLEDYNSNIVSNEDKTYNKEKFLDEVYIEENKYDSIVSILEKKKNIILEGAPGVGKTFMAKRLAYSIIGEKDPSKLCLIQFHQSYSYEDFIEGYRPTENGFKLEHGVFYNFCKKAEEDKDPNSKYYMIIDEINRGNLSKIFGELLMLIESDKRGERLKLAYSEEEFTVPNNLYIIGLMNTADRSLALIDYALRRRFSFIRIEPAFENEKFLRDFKNKFDNDYDNLIEIIKKINDAIENDKSLGSGFKIGHSYFCPDIKDRKGNKKDLEDIITYEIIPLLEEYWYDDEDSILQWKNALDGVIND